MPIDVRDVADDPRVQILRLWLGPAVTLAFAAFLAQLTATSAALPGASLLFSLLVVVSAWVGGAGPGLSSVALAIAHESWRLTVAPGSGGFQPYDLLRVASGALVLSALALLGGRMREQIRRAAALNVAARHDADFRTILDHAAEPILLADAAGHYTYANKRALEVMRYTPDQLAGMHVTQIIAPESLSATPVRLAELEGNDSLTSVRTLLRGDGSRIEMAIVARRLPDGRLFGILHDIAGQRGDIDRLERAFSLVRATLESTTDGILVVDHEGRWVGYNQNFLRMWNVPAEIVSGADDSRALMENAMNQLADPGPFLARVRELYEAPESESFDEFRMKDGRIFERYSRPQRAEGGIVGRVWSFRDVTAARRHLEELRESEARFQKAQKLEALGRLAGGVAHDFNNMLTAILGETELLLRDLPADAPMRPPLESVREAALRSARLTRQLLAFGRRQPSEPRDLAVAALIAGIEPLVRRLAGPRVHVFVHGPAAEESPWVHVDPSQFEQALLNLVINSHDAMPDGGNLVITLSTVNLAAGERGAERAGPHAVIEVRDTGCGIDPEVRPHLFEPFFTTKPAGKGTGLGLASVYGVVQQASGAIEVESTPGAGTSFRILLPAVPAEARTACGDAGPGDVNGGAPAGRGETILVVEDEHAVRTFVVAVLRQQGYHVLEAAGGEEALRLARVHPGSIELLLTDVMMPGVNGAELARVLQSERPSLRAMLMSGYSGDVLAVMAGGGDGPPLLAKPFGASELARRIRERLDAPVAG